jgi:hypothetical protein
VEVKIASATTVAHQPVSVLHNRYINM